MALGLALGASLFRLVTWSWNPGGQIEFRALSRYNLDRWMLKRGKEFLSDVYEPSCAIKGASLERSKRGHGRESWAVISWSMDTM